MASLKSLLELAATRGTFKAAEMSQAGIVYDKLSRFLDASTEQLRQQQTSGEQNA
jgi:hypothetical protein